MTRSIRPLVISGALALVLMGCNASTGPSAPAGPTISIKKIVQRGVEGQELPPAGYRVQGNVVALEVEVTGVAIVKADGDASGKTGHFHVFIDREPVATGATIPKEPGIVHSTENPLKITGLSLGAHTFKVVLGDGNHARIGSTVAATNEIIVEGPSVKATAQGTPAAGRPFKIAVAVEGATLVKADGAAVGETGHLHVFIDRDPTPPGQVVPKQEGIIHSAETTIEIPALAAGDHTIWVVLGHGNHAAFGEGTPDRAPGPSLDRLKLTL